jgi:hypothetical protein
MAILVIDCPHAGCRPNPTRLKVLNNCPQASTGNVVSFGLCQRCDRPVAVVLARGEHAQVDRKWFRKYEADEDHDLAQVSGWAIKEIFPSPIIRFVPEHTPSAIAALYRQAKSALGKEEFEAAGFLFRTIVERSLRILLGARSASLLQRIGALAEDGCIPVWLQHWAGELRIIAADGIPAGVDVQGHDVRAAAEFVEAFLLIVFTARTNFESRLSSYGPAAEAEATPGEMAI